MKPTSPSSPNRTPRRHPTQTAAQSSTRTLAPPSPASQPISKPAAPAQQPLPAPQEPAPITLTSLRARFRASTVLPAWVLLPLRLFLGVTFVYAGLQKLTDPHYFQKGTPTSISTQIAAFAHGTPLQGFLLHMALPHAVLFGALVAYGELAIGIGTLIGLLMRPAACFGLLLSLTFFLSASWRVYPYFYGADIVFVFGWLTLLLAGPDAGGVWPTLDARLARRVLRAIAARDPARRVAVARGLALVLGVSDASDHPATAQAQSVTESASARQPVRRGRVTVNQRYRGRGSSTMARRELLRGIALGGGGMLALVWLRSVLFPSAPDPASTASAQGGGTAGSGSSAGAPAANASGTAATGPETIGEVSQIAPNSAVSFTIPTNQDPGVLVHLSDGKFAAFDATCTHAGCPVQYDPSSQLLLCPCHGAAFDPAHNAAVVQGPTDVPLAGVPISVDQATGAITLKS
jgi:thiosulfate dehydrogenase [quinone] large subunit